MDATILMLLLRPDAGAPADATGGRVSHAPERIQLLVEELEKAGTKVLIPTPALSEVLVRSDASEAQHIIDSLHHFAVIRIEPFDTRAAIEVAAMTRSALDKKDKRGSSTSVWAKVKYDRQIVAIAKVNQATTIYSDDRDIRTLAKEANIAVVGLGDHPLPAKLLQTELGLETPYK